MKNTQINVQSADIYKTVKKIRIEDDSTLPDYCSDIMRVIKNECIPVITSKKIYVREGTMFCDVSGTVVFNTVYVSDNGSVESHSFSSDFYDTSKADVSTADADTVYAFVNAFADNTVCKAQSSRRLSVRCDVCLGIDVRANLPFECFADSEGKTESIKRQVNVLKIVSSKDAEFKVSEEIKLPKSCPPMERILSAVLTLSLDEAKAGDNSVSFWGNAGISCVYLPESDSEQGIQSFYQPLEIKGSFEVEDSRGDMSVVARLIGSKPEYEILSDNLGENRILKIDFPYTVQCLVEENSPVTVTQDIYGVGCKVTPVYDNKEFRKYMGTLRETTAIKERIPLKQVISSVEGASAEVTLRDTYFENGELFANCRITVSAIGVSDEMPCQVSESFDTAVHLNLPSEVSSCSKDLSFDISQSIGFVDVKTEDGCGNAAFDITTVAHIYYNDKASFVSASDIEESAVECSDSVFCYPSDSDTLWSVGKRYGVSLSALADANGMGNSEQLKRVMIIPV